MTTKTQFINISASGVPQAIGHYSHYVETPNGFIIFSGQKAWDPQTGKLIQGGLELQLIRIFDNLEAMLSEVGLSRENIINVNCYIMNVDDYNIFNNLYTTLMGHHKPARTFLAGLDLRDGALLELQFFAQR